TNSTSLFFVLSCFRAIPHETGASIMTMTCRDVVASFALFAELIAATQDAGAAPQAAPAAAPRPPVFKQDLPNVSLDGWEVTVSHVDYPPGRVGAVHHHAGFVLAYVLEGTVITKISGQG